MTFYGDTTTEAVLVEEKDGDEFSCEFTIQFDLKTDDRFFYNFPMASRSSSNVVSVVGRRALHRFNLDSLSFEFADEKKGYVQFV